MKIPTGKALSGAAATLALAGGGFAAVALLQPVSTPAPSQPTHVVGPAAATDSLAPTPTATATLTATATDSPSPAAVSTPTAAPTTVVVTPAPTTAQTPAPAPVQATTSQVDRSPAPPLPPVIVDPNSTPPPSLTCPRMWRPVHMNNGWECAP